MLQVNLSGNKEQHLSPIQYSYPGTVLYMSRGIMQCYISSYFKHTSIYEPAYDPFTTSEYPYGNKRQVWQEVRSRLSGRRILKCAENTCQGSIHHQSCVHWRNIFRMSTMFVKVAWWPHYKRVHRSQGDCFKHYTVDSNYFSLFKTNQGSWTWGARTSLCPAVLLGTCWQNLTRDNNSTRREDNSASCDMMVS